jgi:hypothetical protein
LPQATQAQITGEQVISGDNGGWSVSWAQANNGRLYHLGDLYALYRSDDRGLSWTQPLRGFQSDEEWIGYGVAVVPTNADKVYYYGGERIMRSLDGGNTWPIYTQISREGLGERNRGSEPLALRPGVEDEIWAVARVNFASKATLIRSNNGGQDFTSVGGDTFNSDFRIAKSIHFRPNNNNVVWVATTNGAYVTVNNGTNWAVVPGTEGKNIEAIGLSKATGSNVAIVTWNLNGRSINATDWNNVSTYYFDKVIWDNAGGKDDLNDILALRNGQFIISDGTLNMTKINADGSKGDLIISTRNAPTASQTPAWIDVSKELAKGDNWERQDLWQDVSQDNTIYSDGGAGPSISTDLGSTWTFICKGVRGMVTRKPVLIEGNTTLAIFPGNDKGVLVHNDGGNSDSLVGVAKRDLNYGALFMMQNVSPFGNGQTLYAGGCYQGGQGSNYPVVIKSTNFGVNWSQLAASGLPNSPAKGLGNVIADIVVDKDNSNDLLVLMGNDYGTVHRSTDGGATFGAALGGFRAGQTGEQDFKSAFISRDGVLANRRYCVTRVRDGFSSLGFYVSDDKGATWTSRARPAGDPSGFSVDPKTAGRIWIGTDYDLSTSSDGGQNWTKIDNFQGVVSVDAFNGRVLIYARRNNVSTFDLWYSPDNGTNWQQLTNSTWRFPSTRNPNRITRWNFALDPNNLNRFWCGGLSGAVYTFTATGATTSPTLTNPSSTTVTAPNSATFSVTRGGNPLPDIQWQRSPNGSTTWSNLTAGGAYSGVTGTQLTVSNTTTTMSGDRFRAVATSSVSPAATSAAATLTVNAQPQPVITSALTKTGTVGIVISSYAITASNSPTSYNATSLPAGLSVNTSTGVISGTPTTAGTFNTTLSATNSGGTGSATLVFTISAAPVTPPSITSALTATATQNGAFSYTITATNSPTSYGATGLPAGLSVNTSTGVISGTPTAAGTSNVTLSAANGGGTGPSSTLVLTVNAASGGSGSVLTGTITGTAGYNNETQYAPARAFDGNTTTFFAPASSNSFVQLDLGSSTTARLSSLRYFPRSGFAGRMVNGVFQASANGTSWTTLHTITATPAEQWISVTISNTNFYRYFRYYQANDLADVSEIEFIGTTGGGGGTPPSITSSLTATATQNSAFSYTITATNSPTSYGATGLPAGLSVNTSTGVISGTPTAAGTSNVTLSATNGGGTGPSSTLVLTVNAASGGTNTGTGLRGRYYTNTGLTGAPALTRTDSTVNFSWSGSPGSGIGSDNFSVRWDGRIEAPVTGAYTFSTEIDDGVRLWVNGVLVLDQWTNQNTTVTASTTLNLTAGALYRVVLEYYEAGGGALARLRWAYPGQATQIIPQGRLYPATSTILSVSNSSFESNTGQTPTGWSTWANTTANEASDFVETANPRIGANNLRHASSTGAYQVNTYRTLTGLTNGTYLVRAWTRSSGGQAAVGFNVSNHGSAGQIYFEVKDATPYYVERTLSVPVTNGQMTIGFWSDATASNQWLIVDEISVERQP